jgi:hypothetical protein
MPLLAASATMKASNDSLYNCLTSSHWTTTGAATGDPRLYFTDVALRPSDSEFVKSDGNITPPEM